MSFWAAVESDVLAQGDWLPKSPIPIYGSDFNVSEQEQEQTVPVKFGDLIVITQSCDLENKRAPLVACCPIHTLSEFERGNQRFTKSGVWESVRQGRREGLHLLASPATPDDNRSSLVVDFRQIYSLPFGFLSRHAAAQGRRWRLQSPYLEHFSQAFARFFMRVGLPSGIPPFK
jgi:hypothetical protein